jgi:hypothetical protein
MRANCCLKRGRSQSGNDSSVRSSCLLLTSVSLKGTRQTRLGILSQCCHSRSRPHRQGQNTPRGYVTPSGPKHGQRGGVPQCQEATRRCAECSSMLVNCKIQDGCVRCKIPTYCGNQCKERHWAKNHHRECTPNANWCPACGEDIENGRSTNITCERCKEVRYCSQRCLNNDFNKHVLRCPMTLPSLMVTETQAVPTSGESRAQMPTLLQPGCVRGQRSILHQPKRKMRQDDLVSFFFSVGVIDNEEVIVNVKNERW